MKYFLSLSSVFFCLNIVLPSFALEGETNDEIIVTATRSPLPLKDYAGSVTVLSGARLDSIQAVHPSEALNEAPGVNIHRGSGQEHLTAIRSPVLTSGAGAGSFLYLEDGVPLRAAGFSNVNGLFESAIDLADRTELTKGPGSVLYGSNAVHGLINILSHAPSETQGYSVDILGNNDGYVRLKASSDGAALSGRYHIAASLAHDGGFRDNSGYDQQKLQIRHDMSAGAWSVKTIATLQNLNQETAGFIQGLNAYKDAALVRTNPNPEAFRDAKSARIAVHLNKGIGSNTNLSLIPYARWTDMSFRRHFVPGKALEDSGHKSIGLLTSYVKKVEMGTFTVGLDSEYTSGFLHEYQPGPGVFSFITGEHFDYSVKSTVISPYVHTRLNIGANTELHMGARADYTLYNYDNKIGNGQFGRFIRTPDRRDDFFVVTPKVGFTHKLNENMTVFGRYARGARAPQTSDAYSLQLNQVAGEIETETLDSIEAGLKGQIGALNLELAAFAMGKDNFFFRNANGDNVVNGKTHHKGIELGFDWPLNVHFAFNGSLTLADHTYAFNDIAGSPSSSIVNGNQVDTAPRTLGFLSATVSPTNSLTMTVKWLHMGSYFTDPGNTAKYAGHDSFTLRGQYKVNNTIGIYGRVDNLFDAAYVDRADFAFGNHRYFPARSRTVFFGLKLTH